MQVLRLTFLTILFAVVLTGCIVQADTFSDKSPFSAPDTLQSSDTDPAPTATATPTPTSPPPPTPTPDKDDYIPTATPEYPPSGKD